MDPLTAILVDDEPHCLETLQWQLGNYCPTVKIVGSYSSSREALSNIPVLKPDIVFLDIEMPYLNAFDLLNALPKLQFHLIFTTAYNEYALKAFRFSALDYLLKPIDKDELVAAVVKAQERNTTYPVMHQMQILVDQLTQSHNKDQRISLPTMDGLEFVSVQDVLRCQSDSNYTHIYLLSGTTMLICRTLKFMEEALQDTHSFLRVHYSHLINLHYVQRYIRGDGGTIIMEDGSEVTVARSRKEAFLHACDSVR